MNKRRVSKTAKVLLALSCAIGGLVLYISYSISSFIADIDESYTRAFDDKYATLVSPKPVYQSVFRPVTRVRKMDEGSSGDLFVGGVTGNTNGRVSYWLEKFSGDVRLWRKSVVQFKSFVALSDSRIALVPKAESQVRVLTKKGEEDWIFEWREQDGQAQFNGVVEDSEGSILAYGSIAHDGTGKTDGLIVKLNADGGLVWVKQLPGPLLQGSGRDWLNAAIPLGGGRIAFVGITGNGAQGDQDETSWVLTIDGDGRMIWQQTLLGVGHDIVATASGLTVLTTNSRTHIGSTLHRYAPDGAHLWSRGIVNNKQNRVRVNNLHAFADGSFFAVGHSYRHAWIAKLDEEGAPRWQRSYFVKGKTLSHKTGSALINEGNEGGIALYFGGHAWDGGLPYSFNGDGWMLRVNGEGYLAADDLAEFVGGKW